ncbi:MAG: hypothetical protein COV60_00200 [Candidatus Magasanikbacteria bacterium CG11_big_fil_rev_8_21_14_0_20_43_7]|uniref:DUF4012 domain-containing protein n=1 Tax=Candidatus Magasanikbacteria bacterium CG11_big_fil_rev_8_21_14_0_20_43_7 TaxID=1974654 RepID=A0A2H0N3G3_9BACT|nr:MAG: hypothetical protein COV60_00200 [Candidatus Magasanikbacteria bacterium CG11_big_fil_rev_8_21_14_0_20_43_7]
MASKTKRIIQTCSVCEKTGHNKRRCSLVTKPYLQKAIQKTQSAVGSIHIPDDTTPASPPPKRNTTKHYVPIVIGKSVAQSAYLIDLSEKNKQSDPSWDAIHSFREKLAQSIDRRTVDFAASIRATKKSKERNSRTQRMSPAFHFPKISMPQFHVPHVHLHLPHITIPRAPSFPRFHVSVSFFSSFSRVSIRRFVPVLFVLLLLIALPLPAMSAYQSIRADSAHIVSASTDAFVSLQKSTTAAFQANTVLAQSELQNALVGFNEVETFLDQDTYRVLADIIGTIPFIGDHVTSRRAMINAGQHIALGNTYMVKGISDAYVKGDMPMTERLSILTAHIEQALPQYEEARRDLVSVNPNILSKDQQAVFEEFLVLYSAYIDDMRDLANLSHVLYDVFGGDTFHRYLLLFQNNHEIRPTGGFIGSFAILDTQKGKIENIDIPGGGSYDVQGQFDKYIVPPLPLQLVNDRWELQDVNWFFDFPTTARKAESFVTDARGVTFDGTIAVNASVIKRLLRVIGPVVASDYDMLLDAENILPTLQHHVEGDYTASVGEAPKEILTNVLDELLSAVQTIQPQQLIILLQELHEALGEKEIQVALKDTASDARLSSFGWTGSMLQSDPRQEYLAVVATNLQGQKSDARITQHIEHRAEVQEDGSVIVRATISRTHTGDETEEFYGATNITYMRTYVPQGSILLDAGGFSYPPEDAFHVPEQWYKTDTDLDTIEKEVGIHKDTGTRITNEFGKTAFGNWMIVPPGETKEIWFTYQLPFSVVDKKIGRDRISEIFFSQPDAVSRYSLFVQKQSGVDATFSSTVTYPYGWLPRWKSMRTIDLTPTGAYMETILTTDVVYGIVLEQHI